MESIKVKGTLYLTIGILSKIFLNYLRGKREMKVVFENPKIQNNQLAKLKTVSGKEIFYSRHSNI